LVFVTAFAYAAAGTLTFNGTVKLEAFLKVDIINPLVQNAAGTVLPNDGTPRPGTNPSWGTMTISPDGQTATISATLTSPNDQMTFFFDLKNNGQLDAELLDNASNTGLTFVPTGANAATFATAVNVSTDWKDALTEDHSSLGAGILGIGDESLSTYQIVVQWKLGYTTLADPVNGDTFTFTFKIDYDPAP